MTAYYNEFDPNAAAWLRELIRNNLIAPGEVDERSITDVTASDLRGFTQHHFFAGIGVWSYALRNAGWSDDMPVCTASLPCQPFSAVGQRRGKDDERHLWPKFLDLVQQQGFPIIFGEQVASKDGLEWLDGVQADLEAEGYTNAAFDLCAAGVGSPHIRQRLYWVGYTVSAGLEGHDWDGPVSREEKAAGSDAEASGCGPDPASMDALSVLRRLSMHDSQYARLGMRLPADRRVGGMALRSGVEFDALACSDGWRRVQRGTFPLVDGSARGVGHSSDSSISPNETSEARVMRLKGYGNAIQAQTAQLFIESVMETIDEHQIYDLLY